VRNASWPEGKAAGLHLDRLVGTDVEADLAFEHNPYLVVSPVKMQRRHVAVSHLPLSAKTLTLRCPGTPAQTRFL